jgi:hypothetical protein
MSSFGLNESRRRDLVSVPLPDEDTDLEMVDFVGIDGLVIVDLTAVAELEDLETFAADEKDLKKEQPEVVKVLSDGTALEGESLLILDDMPISTDLDVDR